MPRDIVVTLPFDEYMALQEKAKGAKVVSEHIRMTAVPHTDPLRISPINSHHVLEIDTEVIPTNNLPDAIIVVHGETRFYYNKERM